MKVLNNKSIFWMFVVNLLLLFTSIIISFYNQIKDSSAASGFFLLIMPMVASFFVIPQFVGLILSGINIKLKKYKMLIFIFLASLLSLGSVIISYEFCNSIGFLFWITLLEIIILVVSLLLKLILKIED